MNKIVTQIWNLAEPVAKDCGLTLWDVEYLKEAGQWVLRVYVDKAGSVSPDGGVSIDDCEAFSRAFDPVLDEADPIEGTYVFEVSSAGAERELKRPSDFEKFLGHKVEVRLYTVLDGAKSHIGALLRYADGDVTIEAGGGEKTFQKAQVAQVRLRI